MPVDQQHQLEHVKPHGQRDRLDANEREYEDHPEDVAAESKFREAQTNCPIEETWSASWTMQLLSQRHE
jgi:hypothetical protein